MGVKGKGKRESDRPGGGRGGRGREAETKRDSKAEGGKTKRRTERGRYGGSYAMTEKGGGGRGGEREMLRKRV